MRRLSVNSGVISSVHRPRFSAASSQGGQAFPEIAHGQQRAARSIGIAAPVQRGRVLRVAVASELVGLLRTQCPRICSEADIKHGYVGDRQRSPAAFQHHQRTWLIDLLLCPMNRCRIPSKTYR